MLGSVKDSGIPYNVKHRYVFVSTTTEIKWMHWSEEPSAWIFMALITIMRMCAFRRKMADRTYGFQRRSAGSPQRSGFRENPTNFLTFVTRWVRDSIFRTNRRSKGEMWLNRQTDTHTHTHTHTQDDYSNPPAHARRGLTTLAMAVYNYWTGPVGEHIEIICKLVPMHKLWVRGNINAGRQWLFYSEVCSWMTHTVVILRLIHVHVGTYVLRPVSTATVPPQINILHVAIHA